MVLPIPPVLRSETPYAIAHRGGRQLWPENTLFAMEKAAEMGYSWFETDLHLTKDRQLVCIHDPTVDRTTNGTGLVKDLRLGELQELDAGFSHQMDNDFPFRSREIVIPTLQQIWERFPDAKFVLELKAEGLEEPLVSFMNKHAGWNRVIIGSFRGAWLRSLREASQGQAVTSASRAEVLRKMLGLRPIRDQVSHPPVLQVPPRWRGLRLLTRRLVRSVHESGGQLHVWTINEPSQIRWCLDMGVDAIITDRPDLLKTELVSRGLWHE